MSCATSSTGSRSSGVFTRRRISPPRNRAGSSRSIPPIAATTSTRCRRATRAAYYVRDNFIGDPDFVDNRVAYYLSEEYAEATRKEIRLDRALPPQHWEDTRHRDTIYMCAVDRDGNACSFINSLFSAFGTGIMGPESGVILHNRGSGFRTVPGHPSAIAP